MNIHIIIGAVISLVCLVVAFRFLHKTCLIDDLPTLMALGAFIGLVELKGTAESEAPLTSNPQTVYHNFRFLYHHTLSL